jgi:hypothetical protein
MRSVSFDTCADELTYQLSLLLEETVDLTTKMNSLAQVRA